MPTPEAKVKAKVDHLLSGYRRAGLWSYKPVSTGHGQHGIPDYIICYFGQFITIETKAPGRAPTPLQNIQMQRLREAGAKTFVIDGDLLELHAYLEEITSANSYEHE